MDSTTKPGVAKRALPAWYARIVRRAKRLKRQVWALFLALKDPATPFLARVVIVCAVAYAVSPIDLIPDFIPVLGQLDDMLILPLLIALAIRLVPREVSARCRREAWAHLRDGERIKTRAGIAAAALFALAWLGAVAWIVSLLT